jgi:3-oxoacid CoA-transferase
MRLCRLNYNLKMGFSVLVHAQRKERSDPDLVNAGKGMVTLLPRASCFGSEDFSPRMIRPGRIELTMLGAMQASARSNLANWMLPSKVEGIEGAMDLVSKLSKTKAVVTIEHADKKGRPKILKQCGFPLTGRACVSRTITDLVCFGHGSVSSSHSP